MDINASEIELLFDAVPDVLFFAKDRERRYTHANITIVNRLGLKSRSDVIGKRVEEVYPGGLSGAYARQDQRVLSGEVIEHQLELQLFTNREPGWCLTCKRPLRVGERIEGLIGISRDLNLGQSGSRSPMYERVHAALAYLNRHYAENVRMRTLMEITGFSLSKLERTFNKVFQMTPQQLLARLRVQMAMHHLGSIGSVESIASVSQSCGFADQSAFTRQFKAMVGMVPSEYRAILRSAAPVPTTREPHFVPLTDRGDKRRSARSR